MKNLFGVFLHFLIFLNMTTGYLVYETSEIPEARAFRGRSNSDYFKNLSQFRCPRSIGRHTKRLNILLDFSWPIKRAMEYFNLDL